jgi:site-specific DNA-methyltransferase (adenine-specific)
MSQLPADSFDAIITDPPYGLRGALSMSGSRVAGGVPVHGEQKWDRTLDVRDQALALWGDRPYAVFGSPRRLDAAPAHREVPLVWDKGNVVAMGDTSFPWRPTYELIYVAGPGWAGSRSEAVLRYPHSSTAARDTGHPTPKPVALMQELIGKAGGGGVVADPFAGSGATLVAAKRLGRRVIGVELDEAYCEVAARRCAQLAFDFGDWEGEP